MKFIIAIGILLLIYCFYECIYFKDLFLFFIFFLKWIGLFLLLNIRRIFVFMLTLSLGTPKMLLKLSLYLHKLPERHYHGTFYLRKINEIEFK